MLPEQPAWLQSLPWLMQQLGGSGQAPTAPMQSFDQTPLPHIATDPMRSTTGQPAWLQDISQLDIRPVAPTSTTHTPIGDWDAPTDLRGIVEEAAATHGVDPRLLLAVIKQESGGQANATSPKGAMGVMQLMPATAKWLGVRDPYDPQQNVMAGAKYLKMMLNEFGSVDLALAAYNAGPGNVKKHGGIPPFAETQEYVRRIGKAYRS